MFHVLKSKENIWATHQISPGWRIETASLFPVLILPLSEGKEPWEQVWRTFHNISNIRNSDEVDWDVNHLMQQIFREMIHKERLKEEKN